MARSVQDNVRKLAEEGGSMMNEPAVESGRTMEALRAQAQGGRAQLIYVAVEARNLAPKPRSLDHERTAAVPLAALTAWQALFDHGGLSAGQSVLIHGAGGGVGVFAVQLARSAGARVIATGRAWAEDLVGELGADEFVDIEHRGFEDVAGEVDVVFDLVGGEIRERSWGV